MGWNKDNVKIKQEQFGMQETVRNRDRVGWNRDGVEWNRDSIG